MEVLVVTEVVDVEVTWLVVVDEVVVGLVEVEVEVAGRHLPHLSCRLRVNEKEDALRVERVTVYTGGPSGTYTKLSVGPGGNSGSLAHRWSTERLD